MTVDIGLLASTEVTSQPTPAASTVVSATSASAAAASTSAAPSPTPVTTATGRKKGKWQSEEDRSAQAIEQYFAQKVAKSSTPVPQRTDDDSFCMMLADELKKVQTPFIKRHTKKQLLETVLAAQEQEEQMLVLNVMQPATTDASAADITAQQLPEQETVDEGAAMLLSFSQQQLEN